jgi:hypothetical protein
MRKTATEAMTPPIMVLLESDAEWMTALALDEREVDPEVAVPTSMKVAVLVVLVLDEWAPEPKTVVPAPTTVVVLAPDEGDGEDDGEGMGKGEGALAPEAVGLEATSAPMVNVT